MLVNAKQALDESLAGWQSWLIELMALANVLGAKYLRERFVEMCIRRVDVVAHEASQFEHNIATTKHWRWGALTKVLKDVLRVKGPFCATWLSKRFLEGDAPPSGVRVEDAGGGEDAGRHAEDLNFTELT